MYPPNMASSSAGIPQDAQMNANNNINPPATGVPVVDYNTHNYNYNYKYNYTPAMNNNNNNVPHHQPYMAHTHAPIPDADNKVEWSTGLFDCFSDFQNCFITFWCPCITFGQIAEIVDKGSTSCGASGALYTLITCVIGTGCIYSCFYRSKMRRQYMLEESPCWDWLVHSCCEPCALCQEYRELHNRGFDMLIGWQGNVERRNYPATAVMMTPTAPPLETMNR